VARHLVAAGQLIDEDPEEAMAHALAARRLASRIAAVREAVGLAAYAAGEWQTAIAELRTYHRMSGKQTHLAVLADCERALGRPERAVDIYRAADKAALVSVEAIELLIVAAGARGDMGQKDAAVAMLQVRELAGEADEPWAARLRYAYADALLAVGRREEAREWFARAADADTEATTDAAERLLELDGVVLTGDEKTDLEEDEFAGPGEDAGGEDGAEASETGAGGEVDEDDYDSEPDAGFDDDEDRFEDDEDGFDGEAEARGTAGEHADLVDEADEDDDAGSDGAAREYGGGSDGAVREYGGGSDGAAREYGGGDGAAAEDDDADDGGAGEDDDAGGDGEAAQADAADNGGAGEDEDAGGAGEDDHAGDDGEPTDRAAAGGEGENGAGESPAGGAEVDEDGAGGGSRA
jgi:tetratricopeptide (TPR) repeat protein